jgi:hypothetical protein
VALLVALVALQIPTGGDMFQLALGVCLALLPLATGAAILRYRLYDIDRIISRTVAYGLLTLVLGGGYAAVALVLGQLVGRDSTLTAEVLAVADQTMQPTRSSLWLRPAPRGLVRSRA